MKINSIETCREFVEVVVDRNSDTFEDWDEEKKQRFIEAEANWLYEYQDEGSEPKELSPRGYWGEYEFNTRNCILDDVANF